MIVTVTGVPGSGKTTYSVNYLLRHYFTYDEYYDTFAVKSSASVLVISNIDGLKLPHKNLDILLEKYPDFWSIENFEKIAKQYGVRNIVLIVDECQKYLSVLTQKQLYLFQYHRHFGMDIFLITQTVRNVDRRLVELSEYIIECQSRSMQVLKNAVKKLDIKGNLIARESVKLDKNIYRVFKSFNVDEATKPKNVLRSRVIILGLSAISFIFIFPYVASHIFSTPSASTHADSSHSKKKITISNNKVYQFDCNSKICVDSSFNSIPITDLFIISSSCSKSSYVSPILDKRYIIKCEKPLPGF